VKVHERTNDMWDMMARVEMYEKRHPEDQKVFSTIISHNSSPRIKLLH